MSWFSPWDGLKTKTCRYLLQRYLGQFFENNLNLEQLKVDLYNGKAVVKNISLKVNAFNDLFEDQGWAFEVVSGHIGCLSVVVPWNALMTNDSSLEISNLTITLRPVTRLQSGTTMLESMWSSVSSSMQMAEECMKQVDDDVPFHNHNNALIGLEKFAETIDNVLNRIRAKLTNTTLNIEYVLPNSARKLIISFKANHLDYKNKTGYEQPSSSSGNANDNPRNDDHGDGGHRVDSHAHDDNDDDDDDGRNVEPDDNNFNALPMIAKHNLVINGLSIHTSETIDYDDDCCPTQYGQLCKIVEFNGSQNIQISIKQTENIIGPKINLEIILDDIYFMLTPRQIHLFIEFSKGFTKERPKDQLMKKCRTIKTQQQTHQAANEYQNSKMTGILGQNVEWSSDAHLDDYSTYSTYTKTAVSSTTTSRNTYVTRGGRKMCESIASSSNSMLTSCTNAQTEIGYAETSGEILKFKIQISQIYGLALHNDILIATTANIDDYRIIFDPSSYDRYVNIADNYFLSTSSSSLTSGIGQIVTDPKKRLPLQNQNYLFVKASPIIINGNQQRYCQELTSKTTLSATMVDLCEVLDNQLDHLILFDRRKNCPDGYHIRPEIVLTQSSSFLYKQNCNRCTNKLECIFDECTADLDISIYDRLSALFGRSPFVKGTNSNEICLDEANQTEFYIKCELLKLQLRFPIVDGRSEQDPQKIPWWKKNVRKDFLALELRNVLVNLTSNISINADEINAFYCETDDMRNAVHLARCKQRTMNANRKIRINIFQLESNNNDMMINNKRKPKRKSPFSSKCPFGYTSNVEGLDGHTEKTDSFLPGETEEINDFCDSCTQSSKLKIEAHIPQTKIVLQSKKIYEIIYNRLNGDLFMWEPRSPHYEESPEEEEQGHAENLCSSAIDDYEERNILLSTSTLESSIYFSMAEPTLPQSSSSSSSSSGRGRARAGATDPTSNKIKPRDDAFSFEAIIEEGCLILYAPVRDMDNAVGKFQINLKELKLFTVTGLNNDKNLGYFCIQLKQIEALHCGNTSIQDVHLAWSDQVDTNLMPTIYNYPQVHHSSSNKRQEVLSIVAEIKKQPEKRIKRMKMSFGISGAILRHNPAYSEHIWLNQLIDFMDVTDYPIEAYEPYALVSEIQLHVWNAAIDYRPKFFTYRAFIDIGYCTLSTNIISSMTGCTLRIIAEDCVLNMGLIGATGSAGEKDCCDILIPVLNLGLLNISFRLNDDNNRIHPAVDLRSSIHDMHLRTCYDSAAALAQLIAYVANDKDLISADENLIQDDSDDRSTNNPKMNEKDNCDQTQIHVNKLMAEAVKDVETIPGKHIQKPSKHGEEGIEIFYFPDEPNEKPVEYHKRSSASTSALSLKSQSPLSPSKYKTLENREPEICNILDFESNVMLQSYYNQTKSQISLPQVQEDLGALTLANSSLEEKDFDIIHDDEILPMDKFGVKQIYVSEDPLQIVDNHFCLPHEKVDLLRPPANFPIPDHSYTLCEMTFTWHMFGGKDFPDKTANEQSKMKKNPGGGATSPASGMSDTYKYGVSQPQNESDKKSKKSTLKEPKGSKRNLDVLVEIQLSKIRFSYEIYPTNSIYSSRQVLLISEIEIRDRLRSSEINKFLYHPNINNISHKPDENMVIVKALSIRPNPQKNSAEECSLRVSILPIKLNIDQDTLLFLEDFFSAVFKNSTATNSSSGSPKMDGNQSSAERDMPVMSVNKLPDELEDSEVKELVERNLDVLIDESKEDKDAIENGEDAASNDVSPVYFREVIFSPALPICFDYHGRRIELSRGPITGLIMGLAQLQGSGICLREIVNRRGILGWNKLFEYLCREWLKDIKRNQLPNILSGIGPTNAVLQLFQGVYDLFRLPIEQYNKDGRIIRGFQLGAQSFTARTALAALEITSRIIHLLQFTAETTFDMLSAGPSLKKRNTKHGKKRQGRPKDLREGVANAYAIVKEGINDSANTLIEAAITEHDQKGYSGAVGAVVRQIPQLVVCPAVLATQATTNILGGAKSSLVPEAKLEARDKWKHEIH